MRKDLSQPMTWALRIDGVLFIVVFTAFAASLSFVGEGHPVFTTLMVIFLFLWLVGAALVFSATRQRTTRAWWWLFYLGAPYGPTLILGRIGWKAFAIVALLTGGAWGGTQFYYDHGRAVGQAEFGALIEEFGGLPPLATDLSPGRIRGKAVMAVENHWDWGLDSRIRARRASDVKTIVLIYAGNEITGRYEYTGRPVGAALTRWARAVVIDRQRRTILASRLFTDEAPASVRVTATGRVREPVVARRSLGSLVSEAKSWVNSLPRE